MTSSRRRGRDGTDAGPLSLGRYFIEVRKVSVSLLLVAPLFLFHELALRLSESNLRNSAELAVKKLFWYLGPGAEYVQLFLLLVMLGALLHVVAHKIPIHRLLLPFLVECLLLAVLLGPLVAALARYLPLRVPSGAEVDDLLLSVVASVGAGLYEELLFRLLLLGGLYVLFRRLCGWQWLLSLMVAVLVSALVFSGYHHLGPDADPFEAPAFAFRALAGILLGLGFAWRGLAVVVYLHAIYDVLFDLRQAAWF
ncbi:MAG: CPBP family glutamic-type intramembrane protease [Planctomycetota bacterium]